MSTASPRGAGSDAAERRTATLQVYQQRAADWITQRRPSTGGGPVGLRERADASGLTGPLGDLGCGPGWFTTLLGPEAIALDAAGAMLAEVPTHAPDAHRVQADLEALPLRSGALAGAYAGKSWVHLPRSRVPMAMWDAHRTMRVRAPLEAVVFGGDAEHTQFDGDVFAGRWFSLWPEALLHDVLHGAGFDDISIEVRGRDRAQDLIVRATRARTLADTVSAGMRLLVIGLNPSVHSADAGVGYVTKGNRFWPGALAAGLVSRDRDPRHALLVHRMGMTDFVKRPTPGAHDLASAEIRAGRGRLERLVEWLQPRAICVTSLGAWRTAVDRTAVEGVQPERFAGRPVYVMGSTSGRNAHGSLASTTEHLRAAAALADQERFSAGP
jgi:TDG/mug DNA glycosylase family protein